MLGGGGVRPVAGWAVAAAGEPLPAGKHAAADELVQEPGGAVQAVPSQCSITAFPETVQNPTAQALAADAAATPVRRPAAGVGTSAHAVPFQCSITVTRPRPGHTVPPTAQALPGEVAATPCRLPAPPRAGPGTSVHARPFQCSINAPLLDPTAQALAAEVAATPAREPPAGGAGLGACAPC